MLALSLVVLWFLFARCILARKDVPASSAVWLKMVPSAIAEGLTGGRSEGASRQYRGGRSDVSFFSLSQRAAQQPGAWANTRDDKWKTDHMTSMHSPGTLCHAPCHPAFSGSGLLGRA